MRLLIATACLVVLAMFGVLYGQQAETNAMREAHASQSEQERAELRGELIRYEEHDAAALARIEAALKR